MKIRMLVSNSDPFGEQSIFEKIQRWIYQHCVVWNIKDQEPVVMNIIKYALDTHLQSEISQHLASLISYFDKKLPVPLLPSATNQVITSLSSFTALRNSFENLSKVLTNLELPLSVNSFARIIWFKIHVSITASAICSIQPDFWNDCVLQFETSTRWPDELSALEKTKTAFLLKISEELAETEYNSFISKDESVPFNENITLLNILTPEGYGFRIRAFTERDELLYLRAVSNADKQKALVQDVLFEIQ